MQNIQWSLPIGALPDQNGVRFRVWAANAGHVEVVLYDGERETGVFALRPEDDGYLPSLSLAPAKPAPRGGLCHAGTLARGMDRASNTADVASIAIIGAAVPYRSSTEVCTDAEALQLAHP